ncbi:hypothetical protein Dimus_003442, partial [Dionaea muscipula]
IRSLPDRFTSMSARPVTVNTPSVVVSVWRLLLTRVLPSSDSSAGHLCSIGRKGKEEISGEIFPIAN